MADKGVVKRAIVTPDKHFPEADIPAINCLLKSIEIVRPDIYIDLGDLGEWSSVSHWQWKRKRKPPLEYQLPRVEEDVIAVNKGLDMIDEKLDKIDGIEKHFCQGNHDEWLDMFVQEHPYLPQYKFINAVKLADRGYKFHEAGKLLKIGKLAYYHGHHFSGVHHTTTHIKKLGGSIMYGHHHSLQQDSETHMDGPKSAWSIGCLKDMSAEANKWLRGRHHKWAHAFAIVDYFEGGLFTVHIIQIINGKCSLWGELIDGNI